MSYINEHLLEDEEIICSGYVHWFVFVPGVSLFLVALVLLIEFPPGYIIFELFMLLAAGLLIREGILKKLTELAFTNRRLIAYVGLIDRQIVELDYPDIKTVAVSETVFGKLLNFGTVVICARAGEQVSVPNISGAQNFRHQVLEIIESEERKQIDLRKF